MAAYKAAAEGVAMVRDGYKELYELVVRGSQEAYVQALEAAKGNTAQQLAIVEDFYNKQDELASSAVRIDAELAYHQKFLELRSEQKKILWFSEQDKQDALYAEQARAAQEAVLIQANIDNLQRQADKAKEVRDIEIQAIDDKLARRKEATQQEIDVLNDANQKRIQGMNDELTKFRETQNAEITALTEALAIKKGLLTQASSDDQLRLTVDDVFRKGLLADGEVREVKALEDAKQRALARSTSAEESARIINGFNELIATKHKEYEEAKGNKSAEVQLAIKEVNAKTNDAVQAKEKETKDAIDVIKDAIEKKDDETQKAIKIANKDTKDAITILQNQIKTQEVQAAYDKAVANTKYAQAVWQVNSQIWDQTKQLKT